MAEERILTLAVVHDVNIPIISLIIRFRRDPPRTIWRIFNPVGPRIVTLWCPAAYNRRADDRRGKFYTDLSTPPPLKGGNQVLRTIRQSLISHGVGNDGHRSGAPMPLPLALFRNRRQLVINPYLAWTFIADIAPIASRFPSLRVHDAPIFKGGRGVGQREGSTSTYIRNSAQK